MARRKNLKATRVGPYGHYKTYTPPEDRFWDKVDKSSGSGCWLWTASVCGGGYGQLNRAFGKPLRAHRFSWEMANGPIPDGLWVLHKCDVRRCVNPDHMFLGDHDANTADMVSKDRHNKGERNPMAKLTVGAVHTIRGMLMMGHSRKDIANFIGVSQGAISSIATGATWAWL